ncbi:MAG: NAD(P)-dependent malic enzyme, partial [Thermoleophilia bacterium]
MVEGDDKTTTQRRALKLHEQWRGKLSIDSKVPVSDNDSLSVAYTPGVAEPCREIARDPALVDVYTGRWNTVAVVTDGSAVLGLGNIGARAALPVMEGKCVLFKEFGGVDAFPICIDSQDADEIVRTVRLLEPGFGGINLEDIAAPTCFEVESRLIEECDIPIFHDDQHGTAV